MTSGLEDRLRGTLLPVLEPYFSPAAAAAPPTAPLRILELASGTGSHSILLAKTYPDRIESIQPTECDEYGRDRIDRAVSSATGPSTERGDGASKVKRARRLDVMNDQDWQALATSESGAEPRAYDIVFGSNFLHMIPL